MENKKKKRSFLGCLDRHLGYLFLIPGILCLLILVAVPVVITIYQSFTNLTFLTKGTPGFVGLDNYIALFQEEKTFVGLRNSLIYTTLSVAFQLLFGFIFAQALQRARRGKPFFRAALIVPWTFPAIVMAFTWRWMLDPNYGVLNQIMIRLGLISSGVSWFSIKESLLVVVFMTVWFGVPFMMMSIFAGLQTVPEDYYEVAKIEGANYWQELRYITLPCLTKILGTLLILRTIWVFNNFDFIYLTTGGGPGYASITLPIYSYLTMWKDTQTAKAAAISVILLLFVLIFVVIYFKLFKVGGESDE